MVAVHEIPWEEASAPGFETTTRRVWREAVQEIADKAKQVLPECNGRVDSAVKIVLTGDVELLPDGKVRVASQSHGTTQYVVCNGVCECRDYRDSKAPSGWCKHRIASGIQKRATALLKQKLALTTNGHVETPPTAAPAPVPTPAESDAPAPAPPDAPPAPLPEAPASVNVHLELAGRQVQLTLRDADEGRLLARLESILQRFPLVVQPADATPARPEGWCSKHGVAMKLNHGKDGSTWYSHKTADGHWCKGR